MEYYQFIFESLSAERKDMLIALLNEIGFTGFEENGKQLKAFISTAEFIETEFENIVSTNSLTYLRSVIKETNWNAEWESGFEPVTVYFPGTDKPFAYLRAGFHKKELLPGYDIEITPKMSFGTGHHSTTYLVIEEMSAISFNNETVIDFGTGTGVLSILAEKMDAASVLAIDNDDWSIENARENIRNNHCKHITILKADAIPAGIQATIILANINLNIIISNLTGIKNACKPGATILFSGIMKHDEALIRKSLGQHSINIAECRYRGEWLMIRAKV